MTYLKNLILVFNFLTLVACQPGGADDWRDEQTKDDGPAKFECSIGNAQSSQPMLCLQRACDHVGGRFDHQAQACQCRAGLYFTGWDRPACEPFVTDMNCYVDSDSRANCLMSSLKDGSGTAIGGLILQQAAANKRRGALFEELQSQYPDWSQVRWSPALNRRMGNHNIIFGDGPLSRAQIREVLDPAPAQALQRQLGALTPQDENIYVASTEDLHRLWRGQDGFENGLKENLAQPIEGWARLLKAHTQAARMPLQLKDTYSSLGCLGYCLLRGEISEQDFLVQQNAEYLGGVLGRRWISIYDSSRTLQAALILTSNGMVSIAAIFNETHDGRELVRQASLYNRNGQLIGRYQDSLFKTESMRIAQKDLQQVQVDKKVQIATCDGEFKPADYLQWPLNGVLQLGPNAGLDANSREHTYFGWDVSPDQNSFAQGLFDKSPFGFAQRPGQSLTEHGRDVSTLLVRSERNTSVGIIPLSARRCDSESDFQILAQQLRGRTRLVNYSASSERQGDACEMFGPHPVNGSGREFLWMIAAGNGGTRDAARLAQTCPQKFSGRQNVIVVAASDGRGVHYLSNAHPDYADIAAPGEGPNGSGWGTSFAAPRVTQVAAQIIESYPSLSNQQIRLAILLGAKNVEGLPVRAEGILDAEDALRLAKAFSTIPSPSLNEKLPKILGDVFCHWSSQCDLQQRKLNIYRTRLF